ncbi:MAG: glycerol uptake facilitator protein [Cyclobacteriaceae bacterium]|jgi:glycerol uptake facilitator protein
MSPFVSEIVGTFILIALGHAVNANVSLKGTYGNGSGWIVISMGWGLAVFCAVTVAGPFSGAHINPAVTFGLATAGLFAWSDVPAFIAAQMIGAALGAGLVWLNFKNHFDSEESAGTKLGVFSTGPAIKDYPINFIGEATGTFLLMLVILYFTGPELVVEGVIASKIGLGSVGALPVAFLVMVIGMGFGGTTGYAINPARDLAPRIMHAILPIKGKGGSNWGYAWIPIFGPILGGILAALLFLGLMD